MHMYSVQKGIVVSSQRGLSQSVLLLFGHVFGRNCNQNSVIFAAAAFCYLKVCIILNLYVYLSMRHCHSNKQFIIFTGSDGIFALLSFFYLVIYLLVRL